MVPRAGVEPARPCGHRFLRPTRLPFRHLGASPNEPRPYHWAMRLAPVLYACLILSACGPSLAPSAAVTPGEIGGTIASAPRISNPPIAPPTPPGSNLPDFACSDASGGKTGVANSIAARMSEQPGYDRFVMQFDSIIPTYTVKRQAKP